jgi:hypothetical protein
LTHLPSDGNRAAVSPLPDSRSGSLAGSELPILPATTSRTTRVPLAPFLLLLVVGVAQRAAVFTIHFPDLNRLITNNHDWLTWQFTPIPALSNHLAASLLLLQQTPPLPPLILGIIAKCATWPFAVNYLLIGLQVLLSIATAMLMFRIQLFFTRRAYLALVAPIVYLLSTDLLFMEYNSQGQTFYENLAMLLVLVAGYVFLRLEKTGAVKYSLLLGLVTALLALTRATFSYFFIVPIVFLVALRPPRLSRHLLAFLLFGVSLQLAWCAKNAILYDRFSLDTSSWGGTNCGVGLENVGLSRLFLKSILVEPDAYPDWFITMTRLHGFVRWNSADYLPYLPPAVIDRDRRTQEILAGTATSSDGYAQSLVSRLYMRACIRFARTYPVLVLRKLWIAYKMFWQPIRNYAHQYVDVFYVRPVVQDPFALGAILTQIRNREIPEQEYLMTEQWNFLQPKPRDARKVVTYSLTLLPTLYWMRNVVAFHVLAPILLLVGAARWLRRKRAGLPVAYLFMLGVIAYVALVSNLAEYGENMRFRLAVEPLIWVSSAFGVSIAAGILRRTLQRGTGARAGTMTGE